AVPVRAGAQPLFYALQLPRGVHRQAEAVRDILAHLALAALASQAVLYAPGIFGGGTALLAVAHGGAYAAPAAAQEVYERRQASAAPGGGRGHEHVVFPQHGADALHDLVRREAAGQLQGREDLPVPLRHLGFEAQGALVVEELYAVGLV